MAIDGNKSLSILCLLGTEGEKKGKGGRREGKGREGKGREGKGIGKPLSAVLVSPQWISFRFSSSSCAGSGKTKGSRSMR